RTLKATTPGGSPPRAGRSGRATRTRAPRATRAAAPRGGSRWGRTPARPAARGADGTRRARAARTRGRSFPPAGGSEPRRRSAAGPASRPPRPRPRRDAPLDPLQIDVAPGPGFRVVAVRARQPLQHSGLEPRRVRARQLDRPRRVAEDLHRFDPGDVVEEPAA